MSAAPTRGADSTPVTDILPNPSPEDTHAVFTAAGTLISVVSLVTPEPQDGRSRQEPQDAHAQPEPQAEEPDQHGLSRPDAPAELWEYEEQHYAFDLVRGLWAAMLRDPLRTVWLPVPPDRFGPLVDLLHETEGRSPATGMRWTVQELGLLIGHDPEATEDLWRRVRRRVPRPDVLCPPRGVQVLPPGMVPHTAPADRVARFAAFSADGVLEGLLVGVATEEQAEEDTLSSRLWELDVRLRAFYTPDADRTEHLLADSTLVVPCSEAEFEDLYADVCRDRGVNSRTGQRWHLDDLAGRLSGFEEACAAADAERAETGRPGTEATPDDDIDTTDPEASPLPHSRPSQED